jgi:sugar O-acyltransferase (sialic acid O-acetyltransferase NeuD family)
MDPSEGHRVVVVGAGENAEIAYEYFTYDSPHEVVAFSVESRYLDQTEKEGLPIVPFEELSERYSPADFKAFVALSSTQLNRVRMRLYAAVKEQGFECVSYVSSKAFVWRNVRIGENTFVFENNVLQHHVEVGDNVILWSGNHVGHRTTIGDHVFVSSHCVISGYCTIGARSFLGVNSCFADSTTVGEDSVVGAGAVVVKDTEPRGVYVGNPARPTGGDAFATFGLAE